MAAFLRNAIPHGRQQSDLTLTYTIFECVLVL